MSLHIFAILLVIVGLYFIWRWARGAMSDADVEFKKDRVEDLEDHYESVKTFETSREGRNKAGIAKKRKKVDDFVND